MYFRRLTSSSTSLSMSGYMSGSPPGMLTMGAPHSSTARRHCSTVRCFLRICAGYWILPQPAHARLHRKRGSSIRTRGYRVRPRSFCLTTYPATVAIWEIGTLIDSRTPFVCHGGDGSLGPSTGLCSPTPDRRYGVQAVQYHDNGHMEEDSNREELPLARPGRDAQVEDQDRIVQDGSPSRRAQAQWPSRRPEPAADNGPAHENPAGEVRQGHSEIEAGLGIVEDLAQEPFLSDHGHRVDHDIRQHHEHATQKRRGPATAGAEGDTGQTPGGIGQEGEGERVEDRDIRDEQLLIGGVAGVVVEAEGNAGAGRRVFGHKRHRPAPAEPRRRTPPAEVTAGHHQESQKEGKDVRSQQDRAGEEPGDAFPVLGHAGHVTLNHPNLSTFSRVPSLTRLC